MFELKAPSQQQVGPSISAGCVVTSLLGSLGDICVTTARWKSQDSPDWGQFLLFSDGQSKEWGGTSALLFIQLTAGFYAACWWCLALPWLTLGIAPPGKASGYQWVNHACLRVHSCKAICTFLHCWWSLPSAHGWLPAATGGKFRSHRFLQVN